MAEAIEQGADILFAFFCEGDEGGRLDPELLRLADLAAGSGAEALSVPERVFAGMADTMTHQGAMAVLRKPAEAAMPADGSWLVLDRLSDPGNAGALIRTAAAAGFAGVLAVKGCADLYAPKTVRAAAGALFRARVARAASADEAVGLLLSAGKPIMAADARAPASCYETDLSGDFALVIGSEGNGLDTAFARAGRLLRVPMPGGGESLNVSAAAAAIMFESVRQRLARIEGREQ
jgi:TrmH family RNA methyltransferase